MSNLPQEKTSHRVLVALDASPDGQAALEAAADLAAQLHAELLGLFVEDINLLRLAGLPFAREIAYSSALQRELDQAAMERTLRSRAAQVRRALASAAERARLPWSFQVTRGHVVRATLSAAADVDLVIVGLESRSAKSSAQPARARRAADTRRVLVVVDSSPASERALELAGRIADQHQSVLVCLVAAASQEEWETLRKSIRQWDQKRVRPAVIDANPLATAPSLLKRACRQDGDLLVLGRDSPLLDEATVASLVERLDYPVVLVR